MKPKLAPILFAVTLLGTAAYGISYQDSPRSGNLQSALAWLRKVQPSFSPEVKKDVPALEAVLRRYFEDPSSLRATEEDMARAFLATMPDTGDLATRDPAEDKMKEFEALMGGGAKPSGGGKPTPPKPKPKPPKRKIPGIHVTPKFSAKRVSAPGGKTIGAVSLAVNGKSSTVVEVLSSAGNMDVYKRAGVVASRMQRLNKENRLWWTMLKVANVRGQYVVGTAKASDWVITADPAFAKEWGVSPQTLARQLVTKIRKSVDAETPDAFGSRDTTPEDLRLAAVDLRQQGDALYQSSPKAAEAKYRAAVENDPSYGVPYLRLAELHMAGKNKTGARSVLSEALAVDGMDAAQKAEIRKKLAVIGSGG